jgi:hypothetical protein
MRNERRSGRHRIGVIGESGVGKSTLLNSLISEQLPLLPQGGVGPLTAVPIEVCHAKIPYLKVGCWGTWRLLQMLDASTRALSGNPSSLSHADRGLARLGMLLASGSQFGQVPAQEVCAFLQQCCDRGPLSDLPRYAADRILQVRALADAGDAGRHIQIEAGLDLPGLMKTMADHGSGFLSPMTASIELGWDGPLLADAITLIDLPGLGIANDLHPLTTHAAASSIQTVLLVVDRSGLTEAAAQLLQRIFDCADEALSDRNRGELNLVVAVTKLDQVITEMVGGAGDRTRWAASCKAVVKRVQEVILAQLHNEVARGKSPVAGYLRQAVARTEIIPVFPLEYQRLHRQDPDDPPRFALSSLTGIPALTTRLRAAVRAPSPSTAAHVC